MLFSGLFSLACSVCSLMKARSTCPGAEALTYSVLVLLTSTTIQKIPYWLSDGSNFSSEVPSFQLTLVPVRLTKTSHNSTLPTSSRLQGIYEHNTFILPTLETEL